MNTTSTIETDVVSFNQLYAAVDVGDYRIHRTAHEFYQRSRWGSFFNAISFFLIGLTARYEHISLWLLVLPVFVFIILGLWRYGHRPPAKADSQKDYWRWIWHQWLLIHIGLLLWGTIVAAVCWRQAGPDIVTMLAVICTIAHATAVSHAYAMHPAHARFGITTVVGPVAMALFLSGPGLLSIGAVLLIYFVYLIGTVARSAEAFNQQISMEIVLINQRSEIARLSLTDTLTGLTSRRGYEMVWGQLWQNAVRKGAPLALLIFDLDHFKRINDTFGHLVGDACLRHFARLLVQMFSRKSDYVARIGGEEFVVILPDTSVVTAQARAEALRKMLATTPCQHEKEEIAMTVSIGVGVVDANINVDADPDATFVRVDHACYEAKHAGRNCIVAA